MNYAIILAGGIGSRFWPLSRQSQPKQFLNLYSCQPLVEETIQRVLPLIKKENIYIATNRIYNQKIKKCIQKFNIPFRNLFFEPEMKNTFAPIAVLSRIIYNADKNAVIGVFPSDHYIKDSKKFIKLVSQEIGLAKNGYIVTLGIVPRCPETGYGYIKISSKLNPSITLGVDGERSRTIKAQSSKVYRVGKFIEKPSKSKAEKFARDKRYFWNGGIFVFRADVLLEEIRRFIPGAYKTIMKMQDRRSVNRLWNKLPFISVDYAVMERTRKMVLLPADYRWTDLGGWQSTEGIFKKDKAGNIFRGNHIDMGSENTTVWTDKRLVATLGLDNIIIVDTKDALLVCSKDKAQDIKKIVKILKQKKFKSLRCYGRIY
jgi:mannose-1-phosphate guanylyltransferase/mannose-6-phosphate isomerase